jgi:predicted permease
VLSAAIVLTVGVGIGGCTAIFAVIDALLLRPLPFPDADRLVWIHTDAPPNRFPLSVVDYQALEAQQTSFEAVAAFDRQVRTFTAPEVAERISVTAVTPGLFELFGVSPLSGRTASSEEGMPGGEATVMVTAGFASRFLGTGRADGAEALGRTIILDGTQVTVIGVLPQNFGPVGGDAEVFTTLRLEPPTRKGPFFLAVFGRIAPGTDRATAAAELRAINRRIFPLWAASYQDERATWGMMDLAEALRGSVSRLLFILMGAVGLLLLVATMNTANLLLARVGSRRRELAVRTALGASPRRMVSHLLLESALLAGGGVLVGLAASQGIIDLLPVVASSYIPRLDEVRLSGTVLGFAAFLALGSGLMFGLISALHGIGGDVAQDLRTGGRTATQSLRQQRYQRLLVAAQLTAAVPLLTGAGLLASSLVNLQRVDPGFDAQNLLTMRVSLSRGTYSDVEDRRQFWDQMLERLSTVPGVVSVGLASSRPPEELAITNNFDLEDRPTPPGQSQPVVPWVVADQGFFQTLGIPLLSGRMFDEVDITDSSPPVVLVDEAWARRFFPGEAAVGRRFRSGGATSGPWTTVVGVVGEVPYSGVGREGEGTVYQPGPSYLTDPFLNVRAAGDPARLMPLIREEIRRVDPTVPLTRIGTGETLISSSLAQSRHLTLVLLTFALVALLLAVIGLYGITANSVQRRRGEIAVRLALGGSPGAVLGHVVWQAMGLAVAGLVLGIAAAIALSRVLSSLLYEVSPNDPRTLAGVAVLLIFVSLVASALPGSRAARVDPTSALREE